MYAEWMSKVSLVVSAEDIKEYKKKKRKRRSNNVRNK